MAVEYERNNTATLWAAFGTPPVDPVSPVITIYDPDGAVVIGPTGMTKEETALWYYQFEISDGWELGAYAAVYEGTLSGVAYQRVEPFNVVAEESLTGSDLPASEYCTVGQVRRLLVGVNELDKLSDIDTIITDHIYRVTEEINLLTGKIWKPSSETIYVDGHGGHTLVLPNRPVRAITSCNIRVTSDYDWYEFQIPAYINVVDGHGVTIRAASTDIVVQSADLLVDCSLGTLVIPARTTGPFLSSYPIWDYSWTRGKHNIVVNYDYGYTAATRPRLVRELAATMVSIDVLLQVGQLLGQGGQSFSVGGVSWGEFPYAGRINQLRVRQQEILDREIREFAVM